MSDQLKLDIETASRPLTKELIEKIGAPIVAQATEQLPTQVGPFIVKRDGLPENVHFGSWKDDA